MRLKLKPTIVKLKLGSYDIARVDDLTTEEKINIVHAYKNKALEQNPTVSESDFECEIGYYSDDFVKDEFSVIYTPVIEIN